MTLAECRAGLPVAEAARLPADQWLVVYAVATGDTIDPRGILSRGFSFDCGGCNEQQ